jgi:hypothetical protein
MKKLLTTLFFVLVASNSLAHDMTPTYPELKPSYMEGLLVADFELFNKRNDVRYYEIAVFDKDWNPIPFVSSYSIFKLEYLEKVKFSVYIRNVDRFNAMYVCSKSRSRQDPSPKTIISSTICSKFHGPGQ